MFHVPALEPPQTWLTVMKEIPVLELVVVKSLQALDMTQRKSTTSLTEFHKPTALLQYNSWYFFPRIVFLCPREVIQLVDPC